MHWIVQWLIALSVSTTQFIPNTIIHDAGRYDRVLIWIHGGGWAGGELGINNHYSYTARSYLAQGWTVVEPEYRLTSHGYSWPAQAYDIFATMQQVAERQRDLGLEPHIVVGGWSAGGHLAAVAGTAWNSDLNPFEHIRPAYTINMAGPLDPVDWATTNDHSDAGVQALVGKSLSSVSAVAYADPEDPPIFVGYGYNDDIVPPETQTKHVEALKQIIMVRYFETMDDHALVGLQASVYPAMEHGPMMINRSATVTVRPRRGVPFYLG